MLAVTLVACGNGSSSSVDNQSQHDGPVETQSSGIAFATFKDLDSAAGFIGGELVVQLDDNSVSIEDEVDAVWVYWGDAGGNKLGEALLKIETFSYFERSIPSTRVPEDATSLILTPIGKLGETQAGLQVLFHDFVGNASLSGPGGNEVTSWYYGNERPKIAIRRLESGLCIFDNGFVSVTDMSNTRDLAWEYGGSGKANQADDHTFPPYAFQCDEAPVNTHRLIEDEYGVWAYSTLNDAMYYGTLVYDTFFKYLGEPALEDKIRLRVHYGSLSSTAAFWDGAYANFGDAYIFYYSMASLDAVAHEVAHGVLNRISDLNLFEHEISTDARTVHEAFGDISGLMAKYEFTGHTDNWIHGEGYYGFARHLDRIQTESDAIASIFDYDDAGDNYYLRIGMLTYPFYVLTEKWGIEPTYKLYVSAARHCWTAMTSLTEAAQCIKQQAGESGLPMQDVVQAFKTVKIKLFEEGVLSHFDTKVLGLNVAFIDDSRTTSQVINWYWDFGDGHTSQEKNPEYMYSEEGVYVVRLTVLDQSNDEDYFERVVTVSE